MKEKIEAIAEYVGAETRSYSGRGMFGKECIGITTDSPREVEDLAVGASLPKPSVDSMGRQFIVYWPSVEA